MKYCLNYRRDKENLMKKPDELNIRYNKKDITLVKFLETYKNKRINIYIDDLEDFKKNDEIKKIEAIKKEYPDMQIFLKFNYDKDFITTVKEKKIPFFLPIHASDWDIFTGLVELGVSDIYVTDSLGFEIIQCAEVAHKNNIRIRTYPNAAQSKWPIDETLKCFFIRPEDVIQYEPYIDTLEFIGDIQKEEVLYKIYKEDKEWYGQLNEIIIGLKSDIDSRFMIPRFAENRLKCKKNCLKGGQCNMCQSIEQLCETLKESEIKINISQENEEEILNNEIDELLKEEN